MENVGIAVPSDLNWLEGQEQTGCSDRQVKFVQALMQGANKTQAAREAGYAGEGSTLRSSASQLAKSHKVRALISWAQIGGAGPSDVSGDQDELKRIAWRHARSKDVNRSIRGTELVHKIAAQEREAPEYVGRAILAALQIDGVTLRRG